MSSAPDHTLPAAQALQLIEVVKRWQIAPEQLLEGLGLTEQALVEPAARVPLAVMNELVERARALTSEPGLGFYLGMQKRLSTYGFLGFATMNATSLREALELAVRLSPAVTTGLSLRLQVEGELAALILEEHSDLGRIRDIALISLVVGLLKLGVTLTGREAAPTVDLALAEPEYYTRFAHLLPNAAFDQPRTQLVFPAGALDLPLATPDRSAMRLAAEQCEQELSALGFDRSLPQRVRRMAAAHEGFRPLEATAAALHLSTRTLKRKLAAHGTSYSALVDQERCERALLLVRSRAVPIDDIATRLGYSTVANFERAFRRWTGKTPAAYRRESPPR